MVTTAPAPIKEYSPKVLPHTIVALAPMVAPFFTNVFLSSFILGMPLLGFITFVKTHEGPQKTSSSRVTPVYKETLFCILHLFPTFTSGPITTFWPILQSFPILEPLST